MRGGQVLRVTALAVATITVEGDGEHHYSLGPARRTHDGHGGPEDRRCPRCGERLRAERRHPPEHPARKDRSGPGNGRRVAGSRRARLRGVSVKTTENHRTRIMAKLDIHDTAGLVRYAIRRGLIRP